jgi:hypothetical protein
MSQHKKGHVRVNVTGHAHMAPGNTDIVHAGEPSRSGGVKPKMSMAAKYDHGHGPKDYSPHGKSVSGTGKSQSPKQTTIGYNCIGKGVEGRR